MNVVKNYTVARFLKIDYLPLEGGLVKLDDSDKSKFKCDLVFTCNLPNITARKIVRINIDVLNKLSKGINLPNRAFIYASGLIVEEIMRKQEYEKLTKTVSVWFYSSASVVIKLYK
ncbi:hypothetical protein [Bullifex sp.]|uniref:hypothetical protein n=1 Tax=Bullifex sp. TaxID=2815808 RepID=UPI002A83D269|nr:hypothetical protein [Bullifex sp.]MDY4066872.1 hypothetical protein [Bullifex sp.]